MKIGGIERNSRPSSANLGCTDGIFFLVRRLGPLGYRWGFRSLVLLFAGSRRSVRGHDLYRERVNTGHVLRARVKTRGS